jgi:hypothetical protein
VAEQGQGRQPPPQDRIIQDESWIDPIMDGGPHRSASSPEQLALDEIGRHYAEGVNLEAPRVRLDAITRSLKSNSR